MTTETFSPSTRRAEVLTGLVILGLSFGSFFLAELGLRAMQTAQFGVQRDVETSSAFYVDDESGLRLIKPNRNLGRSRINNLGFRGPDVSAEKPDDVVRIVFLGSSTTYDASAPEGRNWPHRTATLFSEAVSGCRVDFINAGQPGFGTETMIKLYQVRLKELDADMAIVLPGDINQDLDWLAGQQGFDSTHYTPSLLASLSVLWAKLEKNFRIIELQRQAFSRTGKVKLDLQALAQRFRDRLAVLTGLMQDDGLLVAVAKIGSQLRPGQDEGFQVQAANTALFFMPHVALPDIVATRLRFNEVIAELSRERDFVELDSSLQVPADAAYYSDTVHFTPAGSELMAQGTVQQLLAAPEVERLLKSRGCVSG